MASSYSTDLKIELMVTGENAGTWGDKTNDNLDVIEQAIAGFKAVSIAGGAQTTNLLINNSPDLATSDARNAVIKLTGTITGNQIVTVPTGITKTYIVQNGTVGAFTVEFKQAGGTGTTFSTTDKSIKILFADGTNINAVDLNTLSGTIATAQIADLAITSAKLASFAVTSARLASFAVTSARLASYAVTTSRLATNAVTGIKITQSTITQAKLAANSVGSNQLISTGVTAAAYTTANITVDADGRITAASSGSAGKLIQTITATSTSAATRSSSSFGTYFGATITPTSASNFIMLVVQVYGVNDAYANQGALTGINIDRGGTLLISQYTSGDGKTNNGFPWAGSAGGNDGSVGDPNTAIQGVLIDAPATTSSTTYNIVFKGIYGDRTSYVGRGSPTSRLTLIEVAP